MRDRVSELRRIKGSELLRNEKNFRLHREEQRADLRRILDRVGVAGVLLAYEQEGELVLIDGHMRVEEAPDVDWPVAILDVGPEEADFILATADPLAAMAEIDTEAVQRLLDSIDEPDLTVLAQLAEDASEAALESMAQAEVKPPEDTLEDGFKMITFPVSADEEDAIRKAVSRAKREYEVDATGPAIAAALAVWPTELGE